MCCSSRFNILLDYIYIYQGTGKHPDITYYCDVMAIDRIQCGLYDSFYMEFVSKGLYDAALMKYLSESCKIILAKKMNEMITECWNDVSTCPQ